MNIELNHRFKLTAHDLTELLGGCTKLSTFCSRLEKQSAFHPDRYDPQKYKGDGFELFVEALIKLSPVDSRIGVGEYAVVEGQDIGVDGTGIGVDGSPATVQVKYRGYGSKRLTSNDDHLANFVQASLRAKKFGGCGVDPETTTNMLIITTAPGLNFFTDLEMFGQQVRCIGYGDSEQEGLRHMVDNNHLFWNRFRELCGVD